MYAGLMAISYPRSEDSRKIVHISRTVISLDGRWRGKTPPSRERMLVLIVSRMPELCQVRGELQVIEAVAVLRR
jgi:hypothetical protein